MINIKSAIFLTLMSIGGTVYASDAIDTKTNIQPFSQEKRDINNIKTNNEQEKSQGTSFDEIKQDIYYDKLFGSEQPNTNNDFYEFYYKESQKDLKKKLQKIKTELEYSELFPGNNNNLLNNLNYSNSSLTGSDNEVQENLDEYKDNYNFIENQKIANQKIQATNPTTDFL